VIVEESALRAGAEAVAGADCCCGFAGCEFAEAGEGGKGPCCCAASTEVNGEKISSKAAEKRNLGPIAV